MHTMIVQCAELEGKRESKAEMPDLRESRRSPSQSLSHKYLLTVMRGRTAKNTSDNAFDMALRFPASRRSNESCIRPRINFTVVRFAMA